MSAQILDVSKRVTTLKAVLTKTEEKNKVNKEIKDANGDWGVALGKLRGELSEESLKKVELANSLADWSGDNVSVVKALAERPELGSLRDVALHFDVDKLTDLVNPKEVPAYIAGDSEDEKRRSFAVSLQHKLFADEPSAVLQRMVQAAELPIVDAALRTGVTTFLANQPEFNIRRTSIYKALQHPEAFKDIAPEQRTGVIQQLKTLQCVQALTSAPEALPVLMTANMTTAFAVAELPESTFLRNFSQELGEATARQVYTNAINARIRNEQALMTMWDTWRGTVLATIDVSEPRDLRNPTPAVPDGEEPAPLSLETLFGSMDYCECDECLSLYSPAAYFVELLQYLRHNNRGPYPADPTRTTNPNIHPGIGNTPLEMLFRRRPDLGCLELTCENTFTVLPYVDLANEVMESFVVHNKAYSDDTNAPKQARIDAFNVEDETTSELLAQPQHTNYQAYCILKNEVYPFTLPYHQPIDSARIWLKHLGTSRYELLDTYRTPTDCALDSKSPLTTEQEQDPNNLHEEILNRAVDAEALVLTQEEYIHLTKQAFWPKAYFDITLNIIHGDKDYQKHIGVKEVWEYYGYDTRDEMLDKDAEKGLTFVKKQFLPRTGIEYVDLVEMLQTQFINPNLPRGKALAILESIRFSYEFLRTLVDEQSNDRKGRFAKVIAFLDTWQPWGPLAEALLHPDPCRQQSEIEWCPQAQDFRNWVYCYFERLGEVIVLESGEGPRLPVAGKVFTVENRIRKFIGTLFDDGSILDVNGQRIGRVGVTPASIRDNGDLVDSRGVVLAEDMSACTTPDGRALMLAGPVYTMDGKSFVTEYGYAQAFGRPGDLFYYPGGGLHLAIEVDDDELYAKIMADGFIYVGDFTCPLTWPLTQDTCDLEKVRLKHLDGNSLTEPDYDRIQRFLRLWRKTGWTIDETDKALVGLGAYSEGGGETPPTPGKCEPLGYDDFVDRCSGGDGAGGVCGAGEGAEDEYRCPDLPEVPGEITPDFLHQLVAVRKLLDLTGLPLARLLTFWAEISTVGEKSLYSRLFLTHNLLGMDKVFQADADGNYLTKEEKITEHLPVLFAALRVKAEDITAIMALRGLNDALTLANVSALYRHTLLAKTLHVKVSDLAGVIGLFGEPFTSAHDTLALFETWGKMEDAGFSFRQLNYLVRNQDDPLRPLAPSKRSILQTTKTLYDGLGAIDSEHRDLQESEAELATTELVGAKAGLLFEQADVERILGLLEGTSVYATNAPANLTLTIPESLANKLRYDYKPEANPPQATVQVTGILTEEEQAQAKGLSKHGDWSKAIDRLRKQAGRVFDDVLFGVFSDLTAAKAVLLAGDVMVPPGQPDPNQADPNTAPAKRLYFLQQFLPFLRRWLAHRLIVDTLSGSAGFPTDVTDVLLSDVLKVGAGNTPAITALEQIKAQAVEGAAGWKGYLIPPVDGECTFIAIGETQPAALLLDGQSIAFPNQQEDPSNVWASKPFKLTGGRLYGLAVTGQAATALQWKTSTSPRAAIPASALLPDFSAQGTDTVEVFAKLAKAALLINGFKLSADEVSYWHKHGDNFDDFDFNAVTLPHWLRLHAYAGLRDRLPRTETSLLNLFQWACQQSGTNTLTQTISAVTLWKPEEINKLIAPEHFDLNRPSDFRNEINLVKLEKALQVAGKIAVDIDQLFDWAKPSSKFWPCHRIAQDIHKALRARYDQEDWEQVVKPLNDQLRENQKRALISYLLVQPELRKWGVVDADSLFEFFLIDVQMDPCFETSRIKQAISSVQLYVQRCMLGLEEKDGGVPNDALDRKRWDWMQRYRVWEANRKVFLYPENWIASQLRDDKSPFYKELESELLQKDINKQTVEDALKSYLYKVDEVANMRVVGLFVEQGTDANGDQVFEMDREPAYAKLHVFARTRNAPYFFWYRYFDIKEGNWYPWDKVQVDLPSYDHENANGEIDTSGAYLVPVVWNRRLLIFFPQFMKKTRPNTTAEDRKFGEMEGDKAVNNKPIEYWEIKMGWSEYQNGKWTQKQLCADAVYDNQGQPAVGAAPTPLPSIADYEFIPRLATGSVMIDVYKEVESLGAYTFTNSQLFKSEENVSLRPKKPSALQLEFHYVSNNKSIHSLQTQGDQEPSYENRAPYFQDLQTGAVIQAMPGDAVVGFTHRISSDLLGRVQIGGLDDLFEYYEGSILPADTDAAFGEDGSGIFNELKSPYALYNWEAAFHAPMLLVENLLNAQQFEQALKMCHFIFDPLADSKDDGTEKRFWNFVPFKQTEAKKVLENLFASLQAKEKSAMDTVNEWRDKPFMPHVVARSRPSAYMKWVVMKYLEILIAWGDYLFRQDTIETLNQATQLYVLAGHIYGPRGHKIPKRGKMKAETYNSLLDKWDAFSNAMVELELVFPFSNQTPFPFGVSSAWKETDKHATTQRVII